MAQSYQDEKTSTALWKHTRVHLSAKEGALKEFLHAIKVESLGGSGGGVGGGEQGTITIVHGNNITIINLQDGKIFDADMKAKTIVHIHLADNEKH